MIPKHADLIHAYADGKVLQRLVAQGDGTTDWLTWHSSYCPDFNDGNEWRIKPDEPKKAVIATWVSRSGLVSHNVVGSEVFGNYTSSEDWTHIVELDREVTLPVEE
jgi:hypothetical protein